MATETICKNGHVMNIGFTLCQVCNSPASDDVDEKDLEQAEEAQTENSNEIEDNPKKEDEQQDV